MRKTFISCIANHLMKDLEISLPEKLFTFIQKLVDEQAFESVESFIIHASTWIAELYGYSEEVSGKNFSDLLVDLIISKIGVEGQPLKKVKTIVKTLEIPNKDLILETFGSAKFMFEDAIFAACQFTAIRQGLAPLSKEEFQKSLEKMEEAGILLKIHKDGKVMWKRND